MTKPRGPLALIVIDGWGYSATRDGNAIALAATPFYDELSEKYPSTLLEAHGSRVGLPAGVMGNSEVGHLNIGSGRVIRMDVSLVDHEIETGEFFRNKFLTHAMEDARNRGKALHLMGLISDGQVHSSLTHLYALLKMAKDHGLERVFVHCFLDGRDTPPSSGRNTSRGFRERSQNSVVEKLPLSSDATTRWTATSVGKERSALMICLLKQSVNEQPIQSRRFTSLTNVALQTNLSSQSRLCAMTVARLRLSRVTTQ